MSFEYTFSVRQKLSVHSVCLMFDQSMDEDQDQHWHGVYVCVWVSVYV